ncbi:MAG: hypothetical protein ACOCP8_08975 [archaeon]
MKKSVLLIFIMIFILSFSLYVIAEDNEYEVKAFRNIYFEMSEEEVIEVMKEDEKIKTDELYGEFSARYSFREGYFGYSLNTDFFEDKLYRLTFSNSLISDFSVSKDRIEDMFEIIKIQYGDPSYKKHFERYELKEGYITFFYKWNTEVIGEDKEIMIGITNLDYEFYPELVIQSPDLNDQKNQAKEEKKKDNLNEVANDF